MHILLIGSSGFVGERVLSELIERGHQVTATVHRKKTSLSHPSVEFVELDVTDNTQVKNFEATAEAVLYLPGLLRESPSKGLSFQKVHVEGVANLIAWAKEHNVRRWIHMSALGVGPDSKGGYFETKWQAESLVRSSGLPWLIIRPSIVFDYRTSTRPNFVSELGKAIDQAPFIPIIGSGRSQLQPVSLDHVADVFAQCLDIDSTNCVYELGGNEALSYSDIMRAIARAMSKKKPAIHIPSLLMMAAAALLDRFSFFPVTRGQLRMLNEDNIVNFVEQKKTVAAFGMDPRNFIPDLSIYFSNAARP